MMNMMMIMIIIVIIIIVIWMCTGLHETARDHTTLHHQWNRNSQPGPQAFSKLVFQM